MATAVEAAGTLGQFAPLVPLANPGGTSALPAAEFQDLAALTASFAHIDHTI